MPRPGAVVRLAVLLGFLLLALEVWGQAGGGPGFSIPGYNEIQNNAVPVLPRRRRLNFTNGGCVDNASNASTDCTMSGGTGAPTTAKYLVAACDPTLTAEELLVAGAGLASTEVAANCGSFDVHTASQEAAFLANGGSTPLTCATTQGAGSEQVRSDGTLEWCDAAGTPHRRSVGASLFNVRDYGAVGDGTTDDGPALQLAADAADAAGGGVVQLDCATYAMKNAIRLGDFTTLQGRGKCSVLKRLDFTFAEPSFTAACAAATDTNFREAIRNKARNCGNTGITVRDLVVDGSAITTFPCTSCANVGTDPSVQIDFSAVTDLTIENVKLISTPQDAIFVRGGGARTTISHVTVDGHNMVWGNGAGINIEAHNPQNPANVGPVNVSDNYIVDRGPSFCTANMSVPCAVDADCSGVGGTCGAGVVGLTGIAFTMVDVGSVPPKTIIARNRIETTDNHTGISVSGCSGCILAENRISPFDSGTAIAQLFLGIQVVGATSKSHSDVLVEGNLILGSGLAGPAGDKRGILVDDASSGSARTVLRGNIVRNKSLLAGTEAITVRGVTDAILDGNLVQNITTRHGIGVGSGSTTTANVQLVNNEVADINTASQDCVTLLNTTNVVLAHNTFRNCPRGVEAQAATVSGTRLVGNQYLSVTTPLLFSTADATLFLDEPFASFTAANLPAGAQDGSRTYCSNCKNSSPCAATGGGFLVAHMAGSWDCQNYAVNAGNGAANLVAFWSSASALSADARYKYLAPALGLSTFTPLPSGFPLSVLHLAHTANQSMVADIYNAAAGGPQLLNRHARATAGSESTTQTPVVANDILFSLVGAGWGGDGTPGNGSFSGSRAKVEGFATETYTGTTGGARVDVSVTPNGSAAAVAQERLDQDGTKYLGTPLTTPGGGPFRGVLRSPDGVRTLYLDGSSPIVFDGATTAGTTNRTTVNVTDPTGARTVTLPDANTVTVQPLDCTPSQVVGKVNTDGSIGCVTPAGTISGGGTNGNLTKWTGATSIGNATCTESGGAISGCSLAGNASTATALAANGTNCAAGQSAQGVDASGNAEGCTNILDSAHGGTGANNVATLGRYPRGDGTNFVTSTVAAGGAGSCTNQFVRATNDNAAPTCNTVALGTDTSGNYVASLSNGTGLTGFPAAGPNATGTPAFDYSATLAGNPALTAGQCVFSNDTSGANKGGVICEGSAADTNEIYIGVANPTADRTQTHPDASGTVVVTPTATDGQMDWSNLTAYPNGTSMAAGVCAAGMAVTTIADAPVCGNPTPAAHNLLDVNVHGDTVTGTPVKGDLVVADNGTPNKWRRLPVGAAQQVPSAGQKLGTGTIICTTGPPCTAVVGTPGGTDVATKFTTEVRAGDTITVYGPNVASQTQTVLSVTDDTHLTLVTGFNPTVNKVAYSISSQNGVQWMSKGGAELFYYKDTTGALAYLAGAITAPHRSAMDYSFPAGTKVVFEPYIIARQASINELRYYVRTNTAATQRCRVAIFDSVDPGGGNIFPGRQLWSEGVGTGCGATCAGGECAGGDGLDVSVNSACCTPTVMGTATDPICRYHRVVSPSVIVYPNMLYWIAMACSSTTVTFRALDPTASWAISGYDDLSDTASNRWENTLGYAFAWPLDWVNPNASSFTFGSGPMPYLLVSLGP